MLYRDGWSRPLALVILGLLGGAGVSGQTEGVAERSGGLRAGAAAVELEADDDMVIGGGIGPGKARGQEGQLRASAVVLELQGRRLALAGCDILMMRRDRLDEAARTIEKELHIPFENILINATHTHHAPSTVTIHGYERNEEFSRRVVDGIVEAARRAAQHLEAGAGAQMIFRLGEESSVGQNSRLLLEDGAIFWVGRRDDEVRPTGPFDPELPVIGFQRVDGSLEALIFNHSTHLIGTNQPGARSPSFYGLAAQALEKELGGTALFLAGAFGSTHNLRLSCSEMVHRIEAAVREALAGARPHPAGVLRGLKREITYRVRRFDEEKEDEAVNSYCRKRMAGSPEYTIDVFRKMRRELAKHQGEERKTWVQAVRIGDIAIAGIPGELFTSLGLEIKRRSPFRYTYIAGVANDYIGYIPDARGFELGGYQVWTGFHSLVAPGTGEAIVAAAVELLEELEGGGLEARRGRLRRALTFHAPFDGATDAALGLGDRRLHTAASLGRRGDARPGLPEGVALARGEGRFGDALRFARKMEPIVFYRAERNMTYHREDWSGTVSFWLSLDPEADLEPGYCDPVQITPREWNDAAFFVDFTKDDMPRHFRLGVFADKQVWNPKGLEWEAVPPAERPLVTVEKTPFGRGKWTHVAFTFAKLNSGRPDGVARLYLDGELQGELAGRMQTFTWDAAKSLIFIGLSYVGLVDDLALFDRALDAEEIKALHELDGGIASL
jgi:neutral ceramidase